MSNSKIIFDVELDHENVPTKIKWSASDNPLGEEPSETKAVSIALWDHNAKQSMRIDLWAKDMPVDEMKKFYIECLAGLGDSIKQSTDDEVMANQIHALCENLVDHVKNSSNE